MKAYLYCTKAKPYLAYSLNSEEWGLSSRKHNEFYDDVNGTVCFECEINKVEEIHFKKDFHCFQTYGLRASELLERSCLSANKLINYSPKYALYLENVKKIDKPFTVSTAPQNMCYMTMNGERCVLISIQPQHLCNIANGLKDIEVRKSILNKLKELIK